MNLIGFKSGELGFSIGTGIYWKILGNWRFASLHLLFASLHLLLHLCVFFCIFFCIFASSFASSFGNILGAFWEHSRSTLGSLWDHSGRALEALRECLGSTMGARCGYILSIIARNATTNKGMARSYNQQGQCC